MSHPISHPVSGSSLSISTRSSLSFVASIWLALSGCDETAAPRTSEVPLDGKGPVTAAPIGAAPAVPPEQAITGYNQCYRECFTAQTNATNRETCLLTCTDDAAVAFTAPPKQTLEVVPGTVLAPDAQLPPGVRPAPAGTK